LEAKLNWPADVPAINPRYLPEEPIAARSSAACEWHAGCSPPPHCGVAIERETRLDRPLDPGRYRRIAWGCARWL
jgi:hypothetical protein